MISALSPGNVAKYEFLTDEDLLPEKDLLQKGVTNERFEYSLLGSALEKQADLAKKQYQRLDMSYELYKITKREKQTVKKYNNSNLIHHSKYSFYEYYNIENLVVFLLYRNIEF